MIVVVIGKCTVKMMTTITISVVPRVQTITIIIDTSLLGHHNSLSRYIVRAVKDTLYIIKHTHNLTKDTNLYHYHGQNDNGATKSNA